MNPSEQVILRDVKSIVERHSGEHCDLIAILSDVQTKYRYLPEKALRMVAKETNRSFVDVYGVATFYKHFSLKPRGEHLASVCIGTACHVRGAPSVTAEFERQLGVSDGETTPDKQFTLKTVNCLGACAMGPIVVVDGHHFSGVKADDTDDIIEKAKNGFDQVNIGSDRRIFPIGVRCLSCNHSLMDSDLPIDGFPSVKLTISFENKHGWIRLSSLYGSYSYESEFPIPEDEIVNFFCPHCHTEIIGAMNCPECSAPMVPMSVGGGGIVQICSRVSCQGHILDLSSNPV